jgi:hypothetical protein
MYSTCLFCHKDLGANEVIEAFPIGRRLAFDAAQGRLWVICRSCARWNLVPFDTRLETIDRCEALFRDTRTRFSTDNIGLARVHEGLELVRIGPALRPEFAAWRYGDRFASRRRRNMIVGGALIGAGVGTLIGLSALVGGTVGLQGLFQAGIGTWEKRRIAARFVRAEGGPPVTLSRKDVKESRLVRLPYGTRYGLSIPARLGVAGKWCNGARPKENILLSGDELETALGTLLPVIAGTAGSRRHVADAVKLVEATPAIDEMIKVVNPVSAKKKVLPGRLADLRAEPRLALEMLANEQAERVWLEGELKLLERQWRDAERLAAIADKLALPEEIDSELDKRKGEVGGGRQAPCAN